MATVPSTSSVIYKGPKDWDRFKGEFQSKAYALGIWRYIDPDQDNAWPVEPTRPDMTSYPKRRLRQDFATYTYEDRKYENFGKKINDLTKWVLESVSPAIKETSFFLGKNLREWYATLAESALAPIMENWTITFQMVKRAEIDNGTISYQEVAANLLDHWTAILIRKRLRVQTLYRKEGPKDAGRNVAVVEVPKRTETEANGSDKNPMYRALVARPA
ncbi:hypothetical protein DL768_006138 [Monosporascus sp. mg162]|nr:hypothetical protein DL768_006138 [Monosporascus sp. mg162]